MATRKYNRCDLIMNKSDDELRDVVRSNNDVKWNEVPGLTITSFGFISMSPDSYLVSILDVS